MSETVETVSRPAFANFIAGEWTPSRTGVVYEKRNPFRSEDVIGDFPASGADDVHAAVAAAAGAYTAWSRLPIAARGAVLTRAAEAVEARAEDIARDMTREMGKPLRESRGEATRAATIFRYFASEAWGAVGELYEQATGQTVYTLRRPLGVVGLITPWNFPCAIPAWKLAPALVYGNAVVLKLSQEAPLTGLHLAACLEEAGLPAGVLNVVVGRGAEAGTPLVDHPDVRALSFTGSVEVGRLVRERATRRDARVQLELGGHNPLVVLADADLERAAEAAYAGAFWAAGQKCTATRRIFVDKPVYDTFRRLLLDRIERGRVGDPADPETEVGPVVSEEALEAILGAIARAKDEGARLLTGGEAADGAPLVLAPTLFEDAAADSPLSCEEIFGPVASLYRFSTLDDAIAQANAVEHGLVASLFTNDLAAVRRFARELEAGILKVNQQTPGADVHVPFGGIKASGYGPHEQGRAAAEFYTETVTVYEDA